jgi:hypothetical protein
MKFQKKKGNFKFLFHEKDELRRDPKKKKSYDLYYIMVYLVKKKYVYSHPIFLFSKYDYQDQYFLEFLFVFIPIM